VNFWLKLIVLPPALNLLRHALQAAVGIAAFVKGLLQFAFAVAGE
jgi:hypothetical protein